jgi:hypothetical protein
VNPSHSGFTRIDRRLLTLRRIGIATAWVALH